jgi:hypothetical protein
MMTVIIPGPVFMEFALPRVVIKHSMIEREREMD